MPCSQKGGGFPKKLCHVAPLEDGREIPAVPRGFSFLLEFFLDLRYTKPDKPGRKEAVPLRGLLAKYRELILYVFFGGLTTLVNWGLYWVLAKPLGVPYLWATALAQVAAILFAYVTNRTWVFESKARGAGEIFLEMVRFFGARGVSFLLDLLCMYVGVDLLHIPDTWMKLFANILVIIANYVFSKLFVFRPSRRS